MSARVLVVDDNPLDRRITCEAVSHLGYHVQAAEDGTVALALLAQEPGFDVVLLDLLMPGTDGFAVLEAMKADQHLRHLPVIVVSANDAMQDVVRSICMGATDHLTKPLETSLLAARLDASLAAKRLHDVELDHLAQVGRLTDAARAVQHGERDLSVLAPVAAREDDLGVLARVFGAMAAEVRAREEALREQADRLRIEVDRARVGSRVAEVTGTDGFRALADQAADLRRILADERGGTDG